MNNMRKKLFKYYQKEGGMDHQQKRMLSDSSHQLLMQVHKRFLGSVLTDQTLALDIGCAEGWYSIWMAEHARFVLGVDISLGKLRRAANESKNLRTEYILADWDHMPFKDKAFDVTLFSEGPEHSLDPKATLREVRRVLKNGGFLSISAPIEPESRYDRFIRSRIERKENPFSEPFRGHLRTFTPASFRKIVLLIQFNIIKEIFDVATKDFPFRKTLENLLRKHRLPFGVILAKKLA